MKYLCYLVMMIFTIDACRINGLNIVEYNYKIKRYESAFELGLKEIEKYPRNEISQFYLGKTCYELKRYNEAIKYLNRAKELNIKLSKEINIVIKQCYILIADNYYQSALFDSAAFYYREAFKYENN